MIGAVAVLALAAHLSRGRASFVEMCRRTVERPSENLIVLLESPYWRRAHVEWFEDGRIDDRVEAVLCVGNRMMTSEDEARTTALLKEGLGSDDVGGDALYRYCGASYTVALSVLRALDGTRRLARSFPYDMYNRQSVRKWYFDHKEEIRKGEQAPRYQEIVKRVNRVCREWRLDEHEGVPESPK
jgi:hypothetical protein